jgi:hypothetical protein
MVKLGSIQRNKDVVSIVSDVVLLEELDLLPGIHHLEVFLPYEVFRRQSSLQLAPGRIPQSTQCILSHTCVHNRSDFCLFTLLYSKEC